jgi:acyl-CoA thioesterase I
MSSSERCGRSGYGGRRILVNCICIIAACLALAPGSARGAALRILMLGDSITAGYGVAPADALPARLEARLQADGFDASVSNAGVSGDTTAGGAARLDWVLADHPQFALVELGANDALRGLDPGEAATNLDRILARLQAANVKTLLIGMRAPGNWGRDYQQAFDAIFPRLAAKYHVALYPFILDGVALDPSLSQADGLHPNAQGVAVIVQRLAPAVESLLKGAGKDS